MPEFLLPDLGEGLEEAEIIGWHVDVGDQVSVDQVVVEVETAKAAVEVPVPFAGTVAALHATPGTTVAVGQPLISVATAESRSGRPEGFHEPGVVSGPTGGPGEEASGNVLIGYGTAAATATRRRRRVRRQGRNGRGRVAPVISPIVRKLARDADVDLSSIAGTGPGGIIRRCDVELFLASRRAASEPDAPEPAVAESADGERRIPLRGLRRTVADKMARSRREIPEATVWVDVDVTDLLAARAAVNAADPERPVGLLSLLARFTIAALRRFPELNARIDDGDDGDVIVIPDHVHLGFAAQTDRGLVVPVVRDAHRLTTRELSAAIADRIDAARAGRLGPAELTGSTITINNYGVFGVDGSAAIINHPEVAIVGFGRIIDRPWAVDGQLAVRKVSQLTLAFDHRVCDGGTAGGFLRRVADGVESPITTLADL